MGTKKKNSVYTYATTSNGILTTSDWCTSPMLSTSLHCRNFEAEKVQNAKLGGAFLTSNSIAVFIKKVIYADPATIVFWNDGTKTVSRCALGDTYSEETGLAVAILKKIAGNNDVRNLFTQWLPRNGEEVIDISTARKRSKEQ